MANFRYLSGPCSEFDPTDAQLKELREAVHSLGGREFEFDRHSPSHAGFEVSFVLTAEEAHEALRMGESAMHTIMGDRFWQGASKVILS